jgi:hypothetical protein
VIATTLAMRRLVRAAVGAHCSMPVELVPGDAAPQIVGESHHYVTPGGKPVRWPSAYRRAWGKPIYVASTRRVVVGVEWPGLLGEPSPANDTTAASVEQARAS